MCARAWACAHTCLMSSVPSCSKPPIYLLLNGQRFHFQAAFLCTSTFWVQTNACHASRRLRFVTAFNGRGVVMSFCRVCACKGRAVAWLLGTGQSCCPANLCSHSEGPAGCKHSRARESGAFAACIDLTVAMVLCISAMVITTGGSLKCQSTVPSLLRRSIPRVFHE